MNLEAVTPQNEDKFKVMPHNQEAEQGLLGAILADNKSLDEIADFLRPDHFFFPVHGRIYDAIIKITERQGIASPVALKTYFEKEGELEHVGGGEYLTELAQAFTFSFNVPHYATLVYELYQARSLIQSCQDASAQAYDLKYDDEVHKIIESHEEQLFQLSERGANQNEAMSFNQSIMEAIKLAEIAFQRDGEVSGVTTGLNDIDRILGGLHGTDLTILAGRPSMGKTALATNIGFNAAVKYLQTGGKQGARTALFSLEMGHAQIASRMLGSMSGVSSDLIRKGNLSAEDFRKFTDISQKYHDLPFFTDDSAGLSITGLRTKARRLKRKHDIGLIIVDYLQLLHGTGMKSSIENRTQEISAISRGLKEIAKDLNVPVLALSQLSRDVEKREDKRPQLSDLRESGSIEQDADVVMFVYRDEYYLSREEPQQKISESNEQYQSRHDKWKDRIEEVRNITEVQVAKQRHGPIGTAKLHFDPDYTRFSNLEYS